MPTLPADVCELDVYERIATVADGPDRVRVVARFHLVENGEYIVGRDRETAHVLIDDKSVSRRHALVWRAGSTVRIADAGSLNGTLVGDAEAVSSQEGDGTPDWIVWPPETPVTIGLFTLRWRLVAMSLQATDGGAELASPPTTSLGADRPAALGRDAGEDPDTAAPDAPQALFGATDVVTMAALRSDAEAIGVAVEEREYLGIGGGLGTLAWVDHLRIAGVASSAIRVIGVDIDPSAKWATYCANSQITDDERIRSNSASTPDNIWGFPGFALRETWDRLKQGRRDALVPVLQVFGEPLFAETYTPRLKQVTRAIECEAERIGWGDMVAAGRAIALRKTDDGRYALAWRLPFDKANPQAPRDRISIASHVHIATGYPATRVLSVLQDFRRKHQEDGSVVNAYEPHTSIYRRLETAGGVVIVEGRGIVASRVLQRLVQARQRHSGVEIVHVMRFPLTDGHVYDLARRPTRDHVELQPFNWPKACWGGTLRQRLEASDPVERARLMELWGGTTTADRRDWREGLAAALHAGWYRPVFGDLLKLRRVDGRLALTLRPPGALSDPVTLGADYLIDCTGLVADVTASPFLADLIDAHALPRNRAAGTGPERGMSGLKVTPGFEIKALRNGAGRVFAAGVIAANGPYAAVDSFLGLTYAALRSVETLADIGAPGVRRLGALRSARQWVKWLRGHAP